MKRGQTKTVKTLRRQLDLVRRAMRSPQGEFDRGLLYGAQQAISWALGDNACAPVTCVPWNKR